jgi:hypothetical protein
MKLKYLCDPRILLKIIIRKESEWVVLMDTVNEPTHRIHAAIMAIPRKLSKSTMTNKPQHQAAGKHCVGGQAIESGLKVHSGRKPLWG